MKGGGCRQAFIVRFAYTFGSLSTAGVQDWSDCVDKEKARGEDFTEECKDKVQGRVVATVGTAHVCCITIAKHTTAQRSSCCNRPCPQTLALRECMLQHKDYYQPLLEDEEDFVSEQQEEADAAEATAPVKAAAADAAAAGP